MYADPDALPVDALSSSEQLRLAANVLAGERGVVLFERAVALRPARHTIRCEVIGEPSGAHRCAEEFKVLVENAGRRLSASNLAPLLPPKTLDWCVVADLGSGLVEVWPDRQHKDIP